MLDLVKLSHYYLNKLTFDSCMSGEVTSQLHTEEGMNLALPISGLVLGATVLLLTGLLLKLYLNRREDSLAGE